MKRIVFLTLSVLFALTTQAQQINRETDFNFDWKFKLTQDTKLPAEVPLKDKKWRDVRLPHDFGVESDFSEKYEGCTGYLPGGVGIYQKHFKTSASLSENNTYVLFDGVYNNATFYINGKKLGFNPYGYSPIYFDLTKYLNPEGKKNVLTVHVDHSRYADSRWYTGGGIYRDVKLVTVDKLHIPIWGTFITTPEITEDAAKVNLRVDVENSNAEKSAFTLVTKIFDAAGKEVADVREEFNLDANKRETFEQDLKVASPKLWDCENPNMYKAVTTVAKNGKVVDEYTTPFGIRSIEFKVGEGFYLNGKNTYMKGVCLHHDGGLVGTAVPEGVWRRRFQLLKDAGVNAIRTSHNPVSQEFLDLCDEMGILVQDEIFDELDYAKDKRQNMHEKHDDYITRGYDRYFQDYAKDDLTRSILRDRNHPSVVQWSIGNEIEWTYLHYRFITGFWPDPQNPKKNVGFWSSLPKFSPEELKERYEEWDKGEYILAETARKVNGWVKDLDTSRPTTTNLIIPQISHVSGYADAVDIAGYSYRNVIFPWAHKHFPHKQVTINECPGTWDDWKQVLEHPGVFSMFMWTGIDYIGESNEKWPKRRPWGDMLDLAGFKMQGWNYFKSIWKDEAHISIGTLPLEESGFKADELTGFAVAKSNNSYKWRDSNMHWNYEDGEKVVVEVCSNASVVELFLNGKSLGCRSMSEAQDRIMRWIVPFEAGVLEAKTVVGGMKEIATIKTASKPVDFVVSVDNKELKADAYDVAHIVVQLKDKDGVDVQTENTIIEFAIDGEAKLLGVDCGNHNKHQKFQSNTIESYKGRCLAIIQSKKEAGTVKLTVKAEGIGEKVVEIAIK